MRIGFYGTPEVSAEYLRALASRHEVVAVVSQPDRPRGRSGTPQPSAVSQVAAELGVRLIQPEKGHCPAACSQMDAAGKDLCVVIAFGQRLPCGTCGCVDGKAINVHYSLLPRLRGAAPVQHAILQGYETTGVTVQYVAAGWDEGDVLVQRELAILPDDTCGSLTRRLTAIGVEALMEAVDQIGAGSARPVAQDGSEATYAPLITKADGVINWCEPADVVARKVRAYDPWPGTTTAVRGKRLRVVGAVAEMGSGEGGPACGTVVEVDPDAGLAVCCEVGVLRLTRVQPEGKRAMPVAEYLRGTPLAAGELLG